MGLSARVLGFSSFAILLPQALCTIGAVGLLYATVRRVMGSTAGLIAAAALAITPVTVAIARVNNPDALLVLLLVASAWLLVRALESGRTKHLVLCGAVVGLAFMTKMLQGWMVVPALAAAYLVAGPPALLTRVRQLALAGISMVAVSAAWPVAVALWPGATPYIGGSQDGSVWNLILGYNGFGRLTGEEGGGGGASFGGAAGLWRMFNEQVGGQIAWLLPLAAVGLVAGLWATRRAPRTDLRRAGFVLFGVWALVHVAVFSSQKGIFHPYYVSALAPAVAALCGGGLVVLGGWARRSWVGLAVLDLTLAGSAWLAVGAPRAHPGLRAVAAGRDPRRGGDRGAGVPGAAARPCARCAGRRRARRGVRPRGGSRVLRGRERRAAAERQQRHRRPHRRERHGRRAGRRRHAAGRGRASERRHQADGRDGRHGRREPEQRGDRLPAGAPGLGEVPRRGRRVAVDGADHHRHGRARGDDRRLQRPGPGAHGEPARQIVAGGQLKYVLLSGSGGGPGGGSSAVTTWVQAHGTAVDGVSVGSGTLYEVG